MGDDPGVEHASQAILSPVARGLVSSAERLVFACLIALVAAAHFFTRLPDYLLLWAAYVLTRPLGATLGDTLTKLHAEVAWDSVALSLRWKLLRWSLSSL